MKICLVCLKDVEHQKSGARYPLGNGFKYICRQCNHHGWTFDKKGTVVKRKFRVGEFE